MWQPLVSPYSGQAGRQKSTEGSEGKARTWNSTIPGNRSIRPLVLDSSSGKLLEPFTKVKFRAGSWTKNDWLQPCCWLIALYFTYFICLLVGRWQFLTSTASKVASLFKFGRSTSFSLNTQPPQMSIGYIWSGNTREASRHFQNRTIGKIATARANISFEILDIWTDQKPGVKKMMMWPDDWIFWRMQLQLKLQDCAADFVFDRWHLRIFCR